MFPSFTASNVGCLSACHVSGSSPDDFPYTADNRRKSWSLTETFYFLLLLPFSIRVALSPVPGLLSQAPKLDLLLRLALRFVQKSEKLKGTYVLLWPVLVLLLTRGFSAFELETIIALLKAKEKPFRKLIFPLFLLPEPVTRKPVFSHSLQYLKIH